MTRLIETPDRAAQESTGGEVTSTSAVVSSPLTPFVERDHMITDSNSESGTTTAARTVLSAEELDFFYGANHVLKKVNLAIQDNSITALIGPSGCGKSTLLRTFNRMNDEIPGALAKGKVTLEGQDIFAKDVDVAALRRRVGMVFQKPNPFPKSIFENVVYGPRVHGERNMAKLHQIAEQSLKRAALWDEVKDSLNKSAFELSGGQQQRLCIARVLAVEPDVVLMDEPTSALDPSATFRIEGLMAELKKDYCVVTVTHNLQQAARVSDFTGFLLNGQLVEFGSTEQIFTQPHDTRTEDYVRGRFG